MKRWGIRIRRRAEIVPLPIPHIWMAANIAMPITMTANAEKSAQDTSDERRRRDHTIAMPTMTNAALAVQKDTLVARRLAAAAPADMRVLSSATLAGSPPSEATGVASLSAPPALRTQKRRQKLPLR